MPVKTAVRDGVKLRYLDTGTGDPALVFIHGWTCDRGFWRKQIPHFSRRHRVIAVDLRGHGASDKPVQPYSMAGFAGDIGWLCEEIGLKRPVIVGHSMGGLIALLLAGRTPPFAAGAVFVDAPVLPVAAGPGSGFGGLVAALRSPEYLTTATRFIEGMFRPYSDAALKAWTIARMTATPQHVMEAAFTGLIEAGPSLPSGDLPIPCLFVGAAGRGDASQISARYTNLPVVSVVGAGHFLQMEVPDQFNAMLNRFLEVTV